MESGMSEIQATVAAAGAAVKKEVKAEAKVERSSTTGMTATAKKLKKETSETKEEEQYYSKPGQRLPTPSPVSYLGNPKAVILPLLLLGLWFSRIL